MPISRFRNDLVAHRPIDPTPDHPLLAPAPSSILIPIPILILIRDLFLFCPIDDDVVLFVVIFVLVVDACLLKHQAQLPLLTIPNDDE